MPLKQNKDDLHLTAQSCHVTQEFYKQRILVCAGWAASSVSVYLEVLQKVLIVVFYLGNGTLRILYLSNVNKA